MKPKRIVRATVLAVLVSLSLLSGTTIWANSLAFSCEAGPGTCFDNGCSANGGVCGMAEINPNGTAAAFTKCWCLF